MLVTILITLFTFDDDDNNILMMLGKKKDLIPAIFEFSP